MLLHNPHYIQQNKDNACTNYDRYILHYSKHITQQCCISKGPGSPESPTLIVLMCLKERCRCGSQDSNCITPYKLRLSCTVDSYIRVSGMVRKCLVAVSLWNQLPENFHHCLSLPSFKSLIDNVDNVVSYFCFRVHFALALNMLFVHPMCIYICHIYITNLYLYR